jgi:predicted transcriptional regulator
MSDIEIDTDTGSSSIDPVELAADLTMAWLANPNTRANAEDVPAFLKAMHGAVAELGGTATPEEAPVEAAPDYTPAVTVRKSLASKDHIISLIDGKPYRTLRRHLSTNGLTPEEYRARYKLAKDYPIVAPSYSEARRDMANKIGLGRKAGEKAPAKTEATPAHAKKRGRPAASKAEA